MLLPYPDIKSSGDEATNDSTERVEYLTGSPVLSLNSEGRFVLEESTHSQSTNKPKRKRNKPSKKKMNSKQYQQSLPPTSERHLSDDIAEAIPEFEHQNEVQQSEVAQLQLQIGEEMAQYLTTEDSITKFIDNLWYPLLFKGTADSKKLNYRLSYYKTKMKKKEKVLFDWANKFMQTRECIACDDNNSPVALRSYSYHIGRYILFIALERNRFNP